MEIVVYVAIHIFEAVLLSILQFVTKDVYTSTIVTKLDGPGLKFSSSESICNIGAYTV